MRKIKWPWAKKEKKGTENENSKTDLVGEKNEEGTNKRIDKTDEFNNNTAEKSQKFRGLIRKMAQNAIENSNEWMKKNIIPLTFVPVGEGTGHFFYYVENYNRENEDNMYEYVIDNDGGRNFIYCTPAKFEQLLNNYYASHNYESRIKIGAIYRSYGTDGNAVPEWRRSEYLNPKYLLVKKVEIAEEDEKNILKKNDEGIEI